MLYSCIHMATVGVKGLNVLSVSVASEYQTLEWRQPVRAIIIGSWLALKQKLRCSCMYNTGKKIALSLSLALSLTNDLVWNTTDPSYILLFCSTAFVALGQTAWTVGAYRHAATNTQVFDGLYNSRFLFIIVTDVC